MSQEAYDIVVERRYYVIEEVTVTAIRRPLPPAPKDEIVDVDFEIIDDDDDEEEPYYDPDEWYYDPRIDQWCRFDEFEDEEEEETPEEAAERIAREHEREEYQAEVFERIHREEQKKRKSDRWQDPYTRWERTSPYIDDPDEEED